MRTVSIRLSDADYAMREIRPNHFVYCTPEQAAEYAKSIRQ